ncbi:MAG: KAP family NTPase [Duncaniella sp.]|nr:KAP family NTPase [Duncaniella sp.]
MKQDNKTSLSDTPFGENINDFGTERYVNGLIKFIENSSAPITIALQGEWGSGKTSLMNRLGRALCSDDNAPFLGVNINTWEYSMMSSPEMTVYKILARLVSELTGENTESKKKVSKVMRALYRGGREAIKMIPGMNILIEAANVSTDLPGEEKDSSLSELRDELQRVIDNRISDSNKRGVIVFVDDLDRLNPPVAVEILELLKNVFTLNSCIFVLAIDYEVVVKGLEPKFGKLTDKNEREFRSFFDKIIQVPFSLPVSSYRPMDFVLDSLVSIGYISGVEKGDGRIKEPFRQIVEYSVGKNPRSIKRLINTLSLLSCISKCGKDDYNDFVNTRAGRIANFAIVSIQVCYPKIYKMLALMPNFLKWDEAIATRMNIHIPKEEEENFGWEEILEAACSVDSYLSQRHNDIRNLLVLIQATVATNNDIENTDFENNLRAMIDKSSVTGISEPIAESEVNQKRLIDILHKKVSELIKAKRPDIPRIQQKRNTGNGGLFVYYPDNKSMEVIFRPKVANDKIACEITLATSVERPQHLIGKTFEDMMENQKLGEAMNSIDRSLSPLLKEVYYFEGRTYPESGLGTYFNNFSQEMKFRVDQGWLPDHVSANAVYWINLKSEALFSDIAVIETIADVILAAYDYRWAATHLN